MVEKVESTKEELLRSQHSAWLNSTMTKQLLKKLEELRENFHKNAEMNAHVEKLDDKYFRLYGYGAKTVSTVINLINNQDKLTGLETKE